MQTTANDLKAGVLAALAHPNRMRIIEFLREGPKCNCEIAPALDLEQSNLSRHMKILVQEGIVLSWKDGLRVNYKIVDRRIFDILALAEKVARKETKTKMEVFDETY